MKISEIKAGMKDVDLEARVVEISEAREVQTRYGPNTVANATLEDETGRISLSLWGDQISSVAVGDTLSIKGAYVTKFRGKLQLNVPRSGRIEVLK